MTYAEELRQIIANTASDNPPWEPPQDLAGAIWDHETQTWIRAEHEVWME